MRLSWRQYGFIVSLTAGACAPADRVLDVSTVARLAPGWRGEIVAQVDETYAGWDVEIGDADNDGKNEILTTGCPRSRLYLFEKAARGWRTHLLAENLAEHYPGMGLAVKVLDLNRDGRNEIILGTGQEEGGGNAFFYVFQTDGRRLTKRLACRPECNRSGYTHNLAAFDADNDGVLEVFSAYCGYGEIIRYDVDAGLTRIEARKVHQVSGSGEESLIADVDNDGRDEYITANGFRAGKAAVEIYEFDDRGELLVPPRLVVDGFGGRTCFYASIAVGDVDNNGENEMVVAWKRDQKVNKTTLLGYRVSAEGEVRPVYTFADEDEDLDMAYFEKMMAIADVDHDGLNELIVSTRGDNLSEYITSRHLGYVFLYKVAPAGTISKELLVDFHQDKAESSWLAVGDADNDGRNEIVLATGKGDRTKPGRSYVVVIERE